MKRSSVFLALALSTSCLSAQAAEHSVRFTVLSYNVHGLPAPITQDMTRFTDIGKILKERREQGTAPQVVLLQEAFSDPTLNIDKESGYTYSQRGPAPEGHFFGSGLRILSDIPFSSTADVTFNGICGTWDCYANKGGEMVKLHMAGVPFDVAIFDTHMQSAPKYEAEREKQQEIFWKFIQENAKGIPFVAMGDFNMSPKRGSYHYWTNLTGLQDVGEYCYTPADGCAIADGTDPGTLYIHSNDQGYISLGNQALNVPGVSSYSIRPVAISRPFDKPVNGRMLSDHKGYEVTYELIWTDSSKQ